MELRLCRSARLTLCPERRSGRTTAEAAIAAHLEELSCTAEDVYSYAQQVGHPDTDALCRKLLAISEYRQFCFLMRQASAELVSDSASAQH